MGFCLESARIFLIMFNFVFWLSGVALLGVGIWILTDKSIGSYLEVVEYESDPSLNYSSYLLIAFGALIFIIGFLGCCGAIRRSKCLIGFYLFFLAIIFAGELAAGIIVALFMNKFDSMLDEKLSTSVKNDFTIANESVFTESWENIQVELKCCGGKGPIDYINSSFFNRTGMPIPITCCVLSNEKEKVAENKEQCMNKAPEYFYSKGCKDSLIDWVKSHSTILIGVGCGLAGLQIIGFIFAVCLCRSIRYEEK